MKQYFYRFLAPVIFLLVSGNAYTQSVVVTTYAGTPQSAGYSGDNGAATDAQLKSPSDITVDKAGNLYIADFSNNLIRKVDTSGIITTIAGNGSASYSGDGGPATAASLYGPYALALDASGNIIFADGYNHIVRKINTTTGIIKLFAGNGYIGYTGNGGPATDAELNNPVGIAIDKAGNVYIADDHNNAVRKVDTAGIITTVAGGNTTPGYTGDGSAATLAELSLPIGIAIDTAGNLFIADEENNVIRKVTTSGIISTYAGLGPKGHTGDGGPATNAKLDSATRINFDDSDNLYISDSWNNVIRKVNTAGIISTFAGSGLGADSNICFFGGEDSAALAADFCSPEGVAFDPLGKAVYICDRGNDIIRRIAPQAAVIIDHSGVNIIGAASSALAVYPNPAASQFSVNLTSKTSEPVQFVITDLLGQTIQKFPATTNGPVSVKLSVPSGIYFISAITARGRWRQQVCIE